MTEGLHLYGIQKSERKDKKYKGVFCLCKVKGSCHGSNSKIVHFGATGYEDYTQHGDKERRENYLKRHSKNDKFDKDPTSAHALSKFILWGETQ